MELGEDYSSPQIEPSNTFYSAKMSSNKSSRHLAVSEPKKCPKLMARGEALVSTKIDGEAIQFHFMGGSYQTKEHVKNAITFGHGIQ